MFCVAVINITEPDLENDWQLKTAGKPWKESASRPPNLKTLLGEGGGVIFQMLWTAKGVYSPPDHGYLK